MEDAKIEQGKRIERQRILAEINRLEEQSHATKTPIYQETMFAKLRQILSEDNY